MCIAEDDIPNRTQRWDVGFAHIASLDVFVARKTLCGSIPPMAGSATDGAFSVGLLREETRNESQYCRHSPRGSCRSKCLRQFD